MIPDPASLANGALVLPHVHGTLLAIGIKKDLAALGAQRGSQVTKACPPIPVAPARRVSRWHHHNLQDMQAGGIIITCKTCEQMDIAP
jgi:hypothetical protein